MHAVLLVEDRVGLRQLYAGFLRQKGFAVFESGSVEEARKHLEKREFALVLTDYLLPGVNGLDFLKELRERNAEAAVVVMTAFGEIKLAVEAMKWGAVDFLEKPVDLDYLALVLERTLDHRRLSRAAEHQKNRELDDEDRMIGSAPRFLSALDLCNRVAESETSCLLLGESGVGKELFARRIHHSSTRGEGPLVSINCAAIPADLIESELFGHEKGAFTGAVGRKIGLVEMADGGTLFLDEIGELPLALQPKLLRLMQNHELRRVGGNRVLRTDIRLVCATNRNLENGIREGWFREDLYFRLAVFPISIPPLRERLDDLPELCRHFLVQQGFPHSELSAELLDSLRAYHWPGNIRELKNLLERAAILSRGGPLMADHFPRGMTNSPDCITIPLECDLNFGLKENLSRLEPVLAKAMIEALLALEKGRRDKVATRLGISPKTLYNRMKGLGISS